MYFFMFTINCIVNKLFFFHRTVRAHPVQSRYQEKEEDNRQIPM